MLSDGLRQLEREQPLSLTSHVTVLNVLANPDTPWSFPTRLCGVRTGALIMEWAKGGSERQGDLPKDTQSTAEPGLKDFLVPSPKLIMSGVSTPPA